MLKNQLGLQGCQMYNWMDTPPWGILTWISGKVVTASPVEALPRQVPRKAVYSWQYIYGLWILVHAGTRLGQINPSGLPVTEMIPQVDCLSSSYSLCFFRDLLGDAKLLHPAVPPVSTSWQAFLFATLCSAHKESSSDPSRTTKLCFPPNNFVKDFLVGLKKKFIKHMN